MFPRFNIQLTKSWKKPAMISVFVLNASPLIVLSKAGLLQTIGPLAELWVVPDAVASEFEFKRSITPYITELEAVSKVSLESCPEIHPFVAAWDLGQGESEVLSLSIQKGADTKAVIDDLQARKCAKLLGVSLIGSVGLLVMAKRMGLTDEAKPGINKLKEVGLRIDPDLLTKIYQKIGE